MGKFIIGFLKLNFLKLKSMQENEILFHAKNISCVYKEQNKIALKIKELIIPKGKLIFILGASGSGKSTLLETLGMMNNTIQEGSIKFYDNQQKPTDSIDIAEFWKRNNQQEISGLRKKNFTFIFQQTNLMDNFTAYENVCLSEMIKENVGLESVLPNAKLLLERVKLGEDEVNINKMPKFLSGGQRQRLSFVRALCNNSNVIFCDEPTGNVDESNANELIAVLKEACNDGKTAIIVSHDISLALKHADIILVLTKNPENVYGELNVNNIYERNSWSEMSEKELGSFRNKIKSLFSSDDASAKEHINEKGKTLIKANFKTLFYKRELSALIGKNAENLFVIGLIFLFTFLAIGFANGSLDYLNKKLNSAFVKLVNIPIPSNIARDPEERAKFLEMLQLPANKNRYQYNEVSEYISHGEQVAYYDKRINNDTFAIPYDIASCRSINIEFDKNFINEVVNNDKNFIRGNKSGFSSNNQIAIIATESFLVDFGYDKDANVIYFYSNPYDTLLKKTVKCAFPVEVISIVKELPGKYSFVYPIGFFSALFNDKDNEKFSTINQNLSFIKGFTYSNEKLNTDLLKNEMLDVLKSISFANNSTVDFKPDTFGFNAGYSFYINFEQPLENYLQTNELWSKLAKNAFSKNKKNYFIRTFDFVELDHEFKGSFEFVSIYFKELDQIRGFASFVKNFTRSEKQKNSIQVDLTKVIEKENFNFLSKITLITSLLLVIFSTLAISLFVYYLIKNHLEKIKMNLGTFKAIGLSDNNSMSIYFRILFRFVFLAFIFGMLASLLIGSILNFALIRNLAVDDKVSYFIQFEVITYISMAIILISSLFVSWRTIKSTLSKSPGDLIYNR